MITAVALVLGAVVGGFIVVVFAIVGAGLAVAKGLNW